MNRTKFFNTAIVNGIQEVDLLYNTLSSFETNYQQGRYRTTVHDEGRPDLVSYEAYGTVSFWWIICLVNQIDDPLTDLVEGMVLKIPSMLDIRNFYRKFKVR